MSSGEYAHLVATGAIEPYTASPPEMPDSSPLAVGEIRCVLVRGNGMIPDGYHLLPLPPANKSSSNRIIEPKSKRAFMAKSPEYDKWKQAIQLWLRTLRQWHEKPCRLDYIYAVPDLQRRDLDNAVSALMDAGNGVLYPDDSMVWVLHGEKRLDREIKECQLWFRITSCSTDATGESR